MPSAIGPDQTHFQPTPRVNPKLTHSQRSAKKAATSAKLQAEHEETALIIADTLRTSGPTYKSKLNAAESRDRNWSSNNPNEHFMDAYVSGRYGKFGAAPAGSFDQEEFEEARAVAQAWQWQPLAVPNIVKTPAERHVAHAEPLQCLPETMNAKAVNAAYERYALDSANEAESLKEALFAFAPKDSRFEQCEKFIGKHFYYARTRKMEDSDKYNPNFETPDDILREFSIDLWERFEKGQYHTHQGRFERWITTKWANFFASYKTSFYERFNLTDSVCEDEFDSEEPPLEKGVHYRSEVDAQQAARDSRTPATAATRLEKFYADLENPESEWSSIPADVKKMLISMRLGMKKGEAARKAGYSADHGAKLLKSEIKRVMGTGVEL